ncbi:MAG: phospholipase D-like domain-containing protein [Burkholderiaceae bacterium]|nr:phospholipase D-like domain-containing protein [Burkholderiaceae bacterium]
MQTGQVPKTLPLLAIVAATAAVTFVVVLIAFNFVLGNKQIDVPLAHRFPVSDPRFPRAMSSVLAPELVPGNHLAELLNGEEIFPAMLERIRSARHSITLETYIYWSGTIGAEFSMALSERARAGVRVLMLLDWVGTALDDAQLRAMREAGVQLRRYNPPRWSNLHRLNNRTHRKLLVVDGRVGFTGGVGIADAWRGDAQAPGHFRDTHFRLEGPAVGQMQSAFIDNWLQSTGEVLAGDEFLPPLEAAGSSVAQIFTSSPGGGSESMQLMYLMSIASAVESIRISASYFIPDEVAVASLVAACERGVRVRILLPGPFIDMPLVRRASRHYWGTLLRAGVEIHEYQPTMYHVKVMIVDQQWVSCGSSNFDNRSFRINDEANLNAYDVSFARRQVALFEEDLARSKRITLEEWSSRTPWDKSIDFAASLLRSQL